MKHIFANLKKYWYFVVVIFALLVVQAYCDLSLPDYTSNIIDTGISNYGIEHPLPSVVSEEGYAGVSMFLKEDEAKDWLEIYEKNEAKGYYELKEKAKESWEEYDSEFQEVLAIFYMMTAQAGDENKEQADQMEQLVQAMAQMTPDQIHEMLLGIREQMKEKVSTVGDTMLESMAKQFAKAQYEACDVDLEKMQSKYMWKTGAKMIAMALAMAVCAIIVGFCASRTAAGVGRDLRSKVFRKVMSFSNAQLDKFSTASLITRSTNDVQQIQMVTVMLLRMVLYSPILAVGGIIMIQRYECGMSWVIVLAVALVFCLILALLAIAMPKFKIMQDKVDSVNLVAREILTGLSVIRAFGREKHEEKRFDDVNDDLTRVMLYTNRAMAFMFPALMVIMNGVSVLIIWVASHKIDDGIIQVGSMTAFITYAMLIIMSFLMITMISIMLPRAAVAAERINDILVSKDVMINNEASHMLAKDSTICFDNVSFKYPDSEENALEGIDFTAKPGETTAIIGSTGCGKSTLVKLIPRFFDVTEGKITLGGEDIKDYSLKNLRAMIGYVPQKAILFSGTIESNIEYGINEELNDEAMKERVLAAAEIAQAKDFIEEKDNQYDSAIAQGGSNVSGGQKQRLSIARAIARNPKIYVFDDSFSALDFKTDTALRKALAEKTSDATVIIVAQRVSTIMNADQIIVLEDGKMIGKGKHKELVETCETYAQIAKSQLSEAEFLKSIGKEEN